jgi:hypothetical protein
MRGTAILLIVVIFMASPDCGSSDDRADPKDDGIVRLVFSEVFSPES